MRENAIQLAEARLANSKKLSARVLALANDADARVRFQCALTLGELDNPQVIPALAAIAARDIDDRWVRAAVLSATDKRADELLETFISRATGNSAGRAALLGELCRMSGITDSTKQLASIVDEIAAANGDYDAAWQEAALSGLAEGLRARTSADGDRIRLSDLISGDSPITRLSRERVEYLLQHCGETITNLTQPLDARPDGFAFSCWNRFHQPCQSFGKPG